MTTLDFYRITEYYSVGGTPRTVGNFTDRAVARHIANGISASRNLTLVFDGSIQGEGFRARWVDSKGNIGLSITTETLTMQSSNA